MKRFFGLLLLFALLVPVTMVKAQAVSLTAPDLMTQTDVKNRMQTLIDLAETGTAFYTYDGKACKTTFELGHWCTKCESGTGAGKALNKASGFRARIDFMPTSYGERGAATGEFTHYYNGFKLTKGYSCSGFANYAGWYIFAQEKSDEVIFKQVKFGAYTKETMNSARIGDIIRLSLEKDDKDGAHSAIVISVGSKSVKVLDCNGVSGKNRQCQLNVHTISYASVYDYVTISRATNYVDCKEHQYVFGVCTGCGMVKQSHTAYLNNSCEFVKTAVYLNLNQTYKLSSLPMAPAEGNESERVVELPAGTRLEATGLYKNHYGNYWYAVKYAGRTLYLYSERGDYAGVVPPKISNVKAPKTLNKGSAFSIGGTITSAGKLTSVKALVRYSDTGKIAIQSSDAPNKTSYKLGGSKVDNNLKFGTLKNGSYLYQITARTEYALASGTELQTHTSEEVTVFEQALTVKSHSHSYKTTVTAPTCTEEGYTTYTCACGSTKKDDETAALGHDWLADIIGLPCQGAGDLVQICQRCGATEVLGSIEDGHYYVEGFDNCCFYCGEPNPGSATVTLQPIPEPVMGGDLKISFGASGMGASMEKTYTLLVALYHGETGQMVACEQVEVTGGELNELAPETFLTPPAQMPLVWKAFLLDPTTGTPVSEAASGVVEIEEA